MIDRFLEYLTIERRYSRLTVEAYQHDLLQFCEYMNTDPEHFDPNKIGEEDIRNWSIDLMDNKQSTRSINRKLSALRSYFKFCLEIGIIEKDITNKVIRPKNSKPLPAFFKESEMNNALEAEDKADDFESVRNNLILEMLYQTGMRRAELIQLSDQDVNLETKLILIHGKRDKERLVPIGDQLCKQIEYYLMFRNSTIELQTDKFFVSNLGHQLYPSIVYNIVHNRMQEVSTQKKLSPHVMRHTFATTMLNNGADINSIKKLLGHANLAATQVYTHTTIAEIKKIYDNSHPRGKNNNNQ